MPTIAALPALLLSALLSSALLTGAVAAPVQAAPQVATQALVNSATQPAIASFFSSPEFSAALLSPDARFLAMRMVGPNGRERLAVVDLSNNAIKVVAQFADVDVGRFEWVNDNRLVFDTDDKDAALGELVYAPGIYAVNRDGGDFLQLANRSANPKNQGASLVLPANTRLSNQKGLQDSDYIYVLSQHRDGAGQPDYINLLHLNTRTGQSRLVERPGPVRRWLLDHQGEPRLAVTRERNVEQIFYREPGSGAWRQLAQSDAYLGGKDSFSPLAFGPDGALYVRARIGGDKSAIHAYDLAAGKVGKQLVAVDGYDFSGALITSNNEMLGVRYLAKAYSTLWFSPRMQALQKLADEALPDTINQLSVAARAPSGKVLVVAYSDRQPAIYYLLDSASGKLSKVGATHPAIDPAIMATQELVHYAARDGLTIPAWLTIPHGSTRKNLPLVVLVHGGPYVRGTSWGWGAQAQFLASRGYAVLEPEYRGSTGFGAKHFKAGWKQWGLKMQDDIADGARWAIGEGIVDAKRICIAGASYGGYATLMGLVNDPDLYRCGIEWAGVTDIGLMYSGHWSFASDMNDDWKQYGMPELIGDPVKDAAQLAATSPLQQAARIKQPLLLAYGDADKRVPLYHGKKFYDAVKTTNPDVEWVVYADEGHGWATLKNRIDFWSRVEKFLARNIGPAIGPSVAPSAVPSAGQPSP